MKDELRKSKGQEGWKGKRVGEEDVEREKGKVFY